ncbi:cysteine sulfinic acid decarboxylase [Diabrotica virgifera virgifera]|uniref:Cysteine sulfinic acid decarboxylase-like n=1 Tax=Diabrotica virgifera virgifera TaxID=50390 RepID=A0A6P7H2G9_DIAVI|nr:cysteine sulfinic acid decarboxylase [Diabrotica virgifera virgifera]
MIANRRELIVNVVDEPATYSDAVATSSDEENQCSDTDLKHTILNPSALKKTATFQSHANRKDHEDFFRASLEVLLKEAVFEGTDRGNKVLNFQNPEHLFKIFDFQLRKSPSTHADLLKIVKDVVLYSVKTGHPYFVNQLFSSLDPYGLVGQWLTDALNPSVYTYEVSPVFTLMEETVLMEMRKIVGFKDGEGDGIFCPGGSMANGYAINCARYKFMPSIKKKGISSLPRLVLFSSDQSHYSITKLSSFLGIGSDNVYSIRSDKRGKLDVGHLREEIKRAIEEKAVPFMVSATAGTTVLGAFDPLDQIADLCEEYKLWLHVDAAWGGGALMSKKHRSLMYGIERADSVTWNPHKLLAAPQQCSTLLIRHKGILAEANGTQAAYLFQKDKFYDTRYDTGDKHVQCGRRVDVLKFWFMWKAKGTSGFEKHIDKVFENSKYFLECIKNREGFELLLDDPECTNVCFWYVPPSLRTLDKTDPSYKEKLHKVAPKIKERMMKEGSMMITYQAQKEHPNFFRIVFQSSGLEKADMCYFIEQIEKMGGDL